MSERKYYTRVIVGQEGGRVLGDFKFPEQTYAEMVGSETVISQAFSRAGIAAAEARGEEIPPELRAMAGLGNK